MAINIKFDSTNNPEPPTIILANKNGDRLGQIIVNEKSIDISDKFNDISEFSFTINKSLNKYRDKNGKLINIWDEVADFKLVYCKEWDMWFEIKVDIDEYTDTLKNVFCKQLGQAELSQIMLYNIEINTEKDISRDDYKATVLYNSSDAKASLLDRILEKAPHYHIKHVDSTIANIQRTFTFDKTSICDAFKEIGEEIGCLFVYNSNSDSSGNIQRSISVYDLQQNCLNPKCNHRGEFTEKCPKCGGTNIKYGYGEDTLIFVTSDELSNDGIQLTGDTDSVKNCFKLIAGDDLITSTVRNCNPNGTDYIWRFSDNMKKNMSVELVSKLNSYDKDYNYYYSDYSLNVDVGMLNKYNALIDKYIVFNKDLKKITNPIKGYSSLMNVYYDTIDFGLFLKSNLMPKVEIVKTNAKEQALLLTSTNLPFVSVENKINASITTLNTVVLSLAKTIVKSNFKVEIKHSELILGGNSKKWKGSFVVTNYSDDKDTANSEDIIIDVNDDYELFVKQKIDKLLSKERVENFDISGLFKKEYNDFCNELKKYSLNSLIGFRDSCQACIDILIKQGIADKSTWGDVDSGTSSNLYEKLYIPYINKLNAIDNEIKVREDEIRIVLGLYDKDGKLVENGLQTYIEKCKNDIQNNLNFEKYLGKDLWLEFCTYRREDEYSNDNYISDGLNNAELFKKALEFYQVAQKEIYKSSELQYSISTTLNNLLAIPKFKNLVNHFNIGNWIRVQVDEKIYKLRLLEYKINFNEFDKISVEFSDVTKIKDGITDVKDVLSQASSMASSYSSIKRQATQGNEAKTTIKDWMSNGLNTALVQIQNNNNEDFQITRNGLLGRSFDEITGTYSPEQIKITHNILAYTDDEWKSVKLAIGKHTYNSYDNGVDNFVNKVGYGINADFITSGIVSGSQIIGGDIYSDNYSVSLRKGSHLNLRDGTFSFAGGALRYDGKKLLISSPDIPTNNQITQINEEYLKTTTVYAEGLQVNSANINGQLTANQINTKGLVAENISASEIKGKTITGGSILIGDKSSTYAEITSAGILNSNGGNFNGVITSKSGNIGGWNISNEGLYNNGTKIKNSGITNIYTWADLYIIRLIVTNIIQADSDMISHYDFNGDGQITPSDYVILKNKLKEV